MDSKILVFNGFFYLITLLLFFKGKQDPSSSLGYGFLILGFWGISLVALIVLLIRKAIQPKTIPDKIGIVTATPVLCILAMTFIMTFNETPVSEWYFKKDHRQYKVNTFDYKGTAHKKRIEYYKSSDTVNSEAPFVDAGKWLKDSTWIYFSESGDTTKIVIFKDDIEVRTAQ